MKKLVLAVMLFFGLSAMAQAACTRKDLTGTWVVYSSGAYSYATRCQLTIPAKGDAATASCYRADGVTGNTTFTIASFDSVCHMTGTMITTPTTSVAIDSYVSKGKDSMSGMWVEYEGSNIYSGSFNGSKQ